MGNGKRIELHLDLILQPMGRANSLSLLPVDPCPPILPMSLRNIGRGGYLWAHLVGTMIETTCRYLSSGCPFPNNTRRSGSAQRFGQSSATPRMDRCINRRAGKLTNPTILVSLCLRLECYFRCRSRARWRWLLKQHCMFTLWAASDIVWSLLLTACQGSAGWLEARRVCICTIVV